MKSRADIFDFFYFTGLALVTAGFALWWPPAGFIIGGVGFLYVGLFGDR